MKRTFLSKAFLALILINSVYLFLNYLFITAMVKRVHADLPSSAIIGKDTLNAFQFSTQDNILLKGWIKKNASKKVVVLLSGIRGNRKNQLQRAGLYLEKGFSVLLPDLRGTGESEGNIITFGWEERKDVVSLYHYLSKMGFDTIVFHGQSLGAAAIVYALKDSIQPSGIILESCYDDIQHAVNNRLKARYCPPVLVNPAFLMANWQYQLNIQNLRPIDYIGLYKGKLLMMAGDSEIQLKIEETMSLYQHAEKNSELIWFEGAGHQDLLQYNEALFRQKWEAWLKDKGFI